MAQPLQSSQSSTDAFVHNVIQQDRTKLLDLTSRNPLISFKHSERSRSHIRIVEEIPERLFNKFVAGRELSFKPLPDPELTPRSEEASFFVDLLRRTRAEDSAYKKALSELGPNAQPARIRELRGTFETASGQNSGSLLSSPRGIP